MVRTKISIFKYKNRFSNRLIKKSPIKIPKKYLKNETIYNYALTCFTKFRLCFTLLYLITFIRNKLEPFFPSLFLF